MNDVGSEGPIRPSLAMLAGYTDSGNANQSAIRWDMICDLRQGGQTTVGGGLFMQNGKIVV